MIGLARVIPWLLPGTAVAIVLGLLVSRPLGRWLGIRPGLAWALVASAGFIVSATLTPLRRTSQPGFEHLSGCDLTRLWPASLADLTAGNDAALNIVLFIPLGIVIAMLPRSRLKATLMVASIALPFAIEIVQSFAAPLGRGCESADVVDNLSGLVIGLAAGATSAWLLGGRASPRGSDA